MRIFFMSWKTSSYSSCISTDEVHRAFVTAERQDIAEAAVRNAYPSAFDLRCLDVGPAE